jgi:uncharacterized protein YndB with AHSA1/START domain
MSKTRITAEPGMPQIIITREFDAPRDLVFRAHTDVQGNAYGFHGVFHGDPSPQAIVQTSEFEGAPGHVKLDTTTLEQRGSKTLVRTVSAFGSVADRDAMIASGMERGVRDSGERLQELLTRLQGS